RRAGTLHRQRPRQAHESHHRDTANASFHATDTSTTPAIGKGTTIRETNTLRSKTNDEPRDQISYPHLAPRPRSAVSPLRRAVGSGLGNRTPGHLSQY